MEEAIYLACERLAKSPMIGTPKRLNRSYRPLLARHAYSNYFIVYDSESEPLRVIRILHRARNIPTLLR